jgi:hypothetical protein
MNWAWLKSKQIWTNVIGIIVIALTYWGVDAAIVTQFEVALLAIANIVVRAAFGEAPGTLVIPKTLPDLIQAVTESTDINTKEAAKALTAAAKVEAVNAVQK